MKNLNAISLLLLIMFSVFPAVSARHSGNDMFIRLETSSEKCYVGQTVTVDVVLYSPEPNVSGAGLLNRFGLDHGDFSYIAQVPVSVAPRKVDLKGRPYYHIPIDAYAVTFDEKGKYQLSDALYRIAVVHPVIINDPFWGRVRSEETSTVELKSGKCQITVKQVPQPEEGMEWSGTVGKFSVNTVVPKGDIIVGEEALALIVLEGEGVLDDTVMPEYRAAFGDGMTLKSVSENRSSFMRDGRLVSRLELECQFIPERRDNCEIGAVRFDYFDADTGKFVRAVSEPVQVKVKSSTVRREAIEV